MIFCEKEDTLHYYENVFCLQEYVLDVKVCCDKPLGKAKKCKVCYNTDPSKFYTPLSMKNNNVCTIIY